MADGPRARKPRKPPQAQGADARTVRPARLLGLTTGEAARHCLVSPDTVGNWISSGQLQAQRTPGGQYRIRVQDLRAFMSAHGMRTESLDADCGLSPACWEFWASVDQTGQQDQCKRVCDACPVKRSGAGVCHEVRPLLPGGTQRAPACVDCIFFVTVRGVEPT